ncbi:LacI family DNA-binding transcriptional regulator [Companilactobacillus sp. HBUAS56257]|jgi:LacI family transcriptional regulator|uniref:LacI family DNA-binding transcriptional regulator n=1 Tax=Companilactobacillus sp. HBUAS56257 TaxID=3109360 RepID=UPI002FF364F5
MASIRDIAKMAGVSAASVSRILNNDKTFSINENTRKRVIDIANRLHYSKEKNLKSPRRTNSEMSIGLILRHNSESELRDPYFLAIHRGIEEEAAQWRLQVSKVFGMRDTDKDWDQLSRYGAIIMVGQMTEEAMDMVMQRNKNLVLVDNYISDERFDRIQTDFTDKTFKVLDLLYRYGHRNIAFVGGRSSIVNVDGSRINSRREVRAVAYESWMDLHGLHRYINTNIGHWEAEDALKMTSKLLQEKELPTAIVVASDPMAMGVYKAINNAGLKIPDDISIVSFDDVEMNRYLTPTLSSIKMDSEEMGRIAVKVAREKMIGNRKMPIQIVCASDLKVRDSVLDLTKIRK